MREGGGDERLRMKSISRMLQGDGCSRPARRPVWLEPMGRTAQKRRPGWRILDIVTESQDVMRLCGSLCIDQWREPGFCNQTELGLNPASTIYWGLLLYVSEFLICKIAVILHTPCMYYMRWTVVVQIQVFLAFWKFPFHHVAFTKDLHQYLFSLAGRIPKRICTCTNKATKWKSCSFCSQPW